MVSEFEEESKPILSHTIATTFKEATIRTTDLLLPQRTTQSILELILVTPGESDEEIIEFLMNTADLPVNATPSFTKSVAIHNDVLSTLETIISHVENMQPIPETVTIHRDITTTMETTVATVQNVKSIRQTNTFIMDMLDNTPLDLSVRRTINY